MTDNQRPLFEAAVVERLKETGFLEIEIRTECLVRHDDGYQDEVITAGWHYWNAALAAEPALQRATDKTHPRFIAGYSAGLNDARLEAGDTPPPQTSEPIGWWYQDSTGCIHMSLDMDLGHRHERETGHALNLMYGKPLPSQPLGSAPSPQSQSPAFTSAEIEEAAAHCERVASEYEARANDPNCNRDHYLRAAERERQEAAGMRSRAAIIPPSETKGLACDGVIPSHPDVDALRSLITEIRAGSPALTAHCRLLPFLEYLLSLLVSQIHAAELESAVSVPTPPPAIMWR